MGDISLKKTGRILELIQSLKKDKIVSRNEYAHNHLISVKTADRDISEALEHIDMFEHGNVHREAIRGIDVIYIFKEYG